MGNIKVINQIAEDKKKAEYIAYKVQMRREDGDYRSFTEILQEEVDKLKATKDTDQDSPR